MKILKRTRRGAASGITLIEVAIAAAVASLVIGSFALMSRANSGAYRTGAMASGLEARVAATVDRLVSELRVAVSDSVFPDPGAGGIERFEYVLATGMTDGNVDQSAPRRLAFEYEVGELDDGLDNNGNGLVDEGVLVLTENVGEVDERSLIVTRWVAEGFDGEVQNGLDDNGNDLVDEPGFVVERAGETLIVRVTLQKSDTEGRLMTRSARTSVRLRN